MGKRKTEARNPSMTWDALRFAINGEEITHRGSVLTVVRKGRRGVMPWIMRSETGAEISARVEESGQVMVGATGRLI